MKMADQVVGRNCGVVALANLLHRTDIEDLERHVSVLLDRDLDTEYYNPETDGYEKCGITPSEMSYLLAQAGVPFSYCEAPDSEFMKHNYHVVSGRTWEKHLNEGGTSVLGVMQKDNGNLGHWIVARGASIQNGLDNDKYSSWFEIRVLFGFLIY